MQVPSALSKLAVGRPHNGAGFARFMSNCSTVIRTIQSEPVPETVGDDIFDNESRADFTVNLTMISVVILRRIFRTTDTVPNDRAISRDAL